MYVNLSLCLNTTTHLVMMMMIMMMTMMMFAMYNSSACFATFRCNCITIQETPAPTPGPEPRLHNLPEPVDNLAELASLQLMIMIAMYCSSTCFATQTNLFKNNEILAGLLHYLPISFTSSFVSYRENNSFDVADWG